MRYILLALFFYLTVPAFSQLPARDTSNPAYRWADSVYQSLSPDERIGQLFMVIADPVFSNANLQKIERYISEVHIGGILFAKGKVEEQAKVTNRCQEMSKFPLLISLDGEWGLSMRLEPTTRFPRNMMLGALRDNELLELYGKEVGRQCREMGIHINFAPVLDVNVESDNPVIGMRSFGSNVDNVADKGIAYAKGLESEGVLSVAKHFPGHGNTKEDSHHTLPLVQGDRSRLEQVELSPFRSYIHAGLSGIMTGHLQVPALDSASRSATSLSYPVVTELLKEQMGFQGICFTDALVMKGASQSSDVCVEALRAGNDILLSPENPIKEFNAIKSAVRSGYISISDIEEKCLKILRLKYALGLHNYRPVELKGLTKRLNTPYAEFLARKLNELSITLIKNDNDQLPLKKLDKLSTAALSLGDASPSDFQRSMQRYLDMPAFTLPPGANATQTAAVCQALKRFDRVIIGIHSIRSRIPEELDKLLKTKLVTLVYFISPYSTGRFQTLEESALSVVMAYENTPFAQDYAGQLVFGGIAAEGRLPVDMKGYRPGAGEQTRQTRLKYQLPEDTGIMSRRLDEIDAIALEGIAEKAYPGCQVLVAYKGVVVYQKAFGSFEYNGIRPVTLTDLYDIASLTKITATVPALMMLYDRKQFKLNDPVGGSLPLFSKTEIGAVSFRNLLFHESGLPAFIPFYQMAIDTGSYEGRLFSNTPNNVHCVQLEKNYYGRTDYKFFPQLCSTDKSKNYPLQICNGLYIAPAFHDSVFNRIATTPLKAKRYLYSDLNFILLGEAASHMAKTPLNKLLDSALYLPLGASRLLYLPLTRFKADSIVPTEQDDFLRKQLLVGYVNDEAAAFLGGVAGNAGLFANANDLAKLGQMFLNGGNYGGEKFVSKETCRLFTHTKSPSSRRGLGFDKPDTSNPQKSPVPARLPGSVFGHTGFTGACLWVDPEHDLIYIFLSNRVYPKRTNTKLTQLDIRGRIHQAVYNALP